MRSALPFLAAFTFCAASLPATAGAAGPDGAAGGPKPGRAAHAPSVPSGNPPARGGALVLDREHLWAYVADADNAALQRVDLSSGDVVTTALECAPQELLLIGDSHLAVSLRACGKVAFLALSPSARPP